jgi:hypothetical protein
MALWSWWQGDVLPDLEPVSGFRVEPEFETEPLVRLTGLDCTEIRARLAAGHRIYVGRLDGVPVSC